ncbi:hypothetical protein HDU76_001167 [Blyttiomyces sp. JEL0837]|nr:hypothetical protein HDU76_001167 [Blyttiomyces sp. JEL0837]
MDKCLPTELIDLIFDKTDILTRCINNRLTAADLKSKGNEIWIEAFRQHWSGDLDLLPQDGFPTALTGLCNVKCRSMYDRLCQYRPDFAGITDSLKVYLQANKRYGYFSITDHRPIILLDDGDEIELGRATPLPSCTKQVYENVLSTPLIHIAMRQCWIKDLEPLIKINHNRLFLLAIKMGHEDLANKMFAEWGIVAIRTIHPEAYLEYLEEIVRNGMLRLLMHLQLLPNGIYSNIRNPQGSVLRKLITTAMEAGQLSILQYIEQQFRGTPDFTRSISPRIHEPFRSESLGCWEWIVDICNNLNIICDTLLVVKSLDEARRVIDKLGNRPIGYAFLEHAARNSNPETFKYLWLHRNPNELDLLPGRLRDDLMTTMRNETDSDTARFKLIASSPVESLTFDAVQFYHRHSGKPDRLIKLFYYAAEHGNLDVVQNLYSTRNIILDDPLFTRAMEEKNFNVNVIKFFGGAKYQHSGITWES